MRLMLSAATWVLLGLCASAPALAAEATKTIKLQLPAGVSGPVAVENLVGTMRVVPAGGGELSAIAVVHAESEELAGQVRFEQVEGEHGEPTLRVRYPLERYPTIRYPSGSVVGAFVGFFLGGGTEVRYDGSKARINSLEGAVLYADVEVQVPDRAGQVTFINHVGLIRAEQVAGRLDFESGSGGISLEKVRGELSADSGSGDIKAADLEGSFGCDTGSGDCELTGFQGHEISCDTGSGDITLLSVDSDSIAADSGSGDIRVAASEVGKFEGDTGSGRIELHTRSARLTRVSATTGSGDVILNLGPEAGFEATIEAGSGKLVSGYADAEPIVEDGEVIGYRRGDRRIQIDVDTDSGDLSLGP